MTLYTVEIKTPNGRHRWCSLYMDGLEAVQQTLADWPEATSIKATPVRRRAKGGAA